MADEGQGVAEAFADTAEMTEENFVEGLKKVIEVAVEEAGVLRKKLTVTVPAQRIQEERDKQYSELITDALVPGFRKGHAPRKLVEKRFAGEVGEQVLTKLLSNAYMAAIQKESLDVLGDPLFHLAGKAGQTTDGKTEEATRNRLVDFNTAMDEITLPDEGALTFACEVEIKPAFEMPELEGIAVERPTVKITNEDVTTQIDRIRAVRGSFAPIGGPVQKDDLIVADLKLISDGKVFKEYENVSMAARPQRVEGAGLDQLGEILTGAMPGDTKTVPARMPDDSQHEELRGKDVVFEIKVNDIKRLQLPPLDAEYLQSQGFEDPREYRDFVRTQMERELDQEIRQGMRGQVCKYLLDTTKIELPAGLSARQVDRAVIRKVVELQRKGVPMADIEKHADELRTSAGAQAIVELKLHFVLEKIAEAQQIEVTEEEINSQIAQIARHYGRRFDRVRDELAKEEGIESLYLRIRDDKCVDYLLGKAKISETTGPATSMAQLAEAT